MEWWGVGCLGVIGEISDDVVVLSFCSPVVVVGRRSLDVCSLFFRSCGVVGFLHCYLGVLLGIGVSGVVGRLLVGWLGEVGGN